MKSTKNDQLGGRKHNERERHKEKKQGVDNTLRHHTLLLQNRFSLQYMRYTETFLLPLGT
jgi:predicted HNH restriction endonuclease